MQVPVYVGLGGNIGLTLSILKNALVAMAQIPEIEHMSVSRFYRTSPVGGVEQADFINAVCRFHTFLTPQALLRKLQDIEVALGKKPKAKNAPRRIDLDILFYGKLAYSSADLMIPHPHWKERLFVLVPLAELLVNQPFISPEGLQQEDIHQLIHQLSTQENKQQICLIE